MTVNLWKHSRQQSSVKCEPNIRGKQTVEDITIEVGFQLHRKITVRVLLDFHIPDSPRQSAKLQVWPMSRERTSSASKRSPWLSVRSEKIQYIAKVKILLKFNRHNFHGKQKPIFADTAPATTTTAVETTTTTAPGDMLGYVFILEQL